MDRTRSISSSLWWILMITSVLGMFIYFQSDHTHDSGLKISNCKMEMAGLVGAIVQYHVEYGSFPTGGLVQIERALLGENLRKIPFLCTKTRSPNANRELVDAWGTPYQIRFLSNDQVVVRSAGKNRVFGDSDDLTTEFGVK